MRWLTAWRVLNMAWSEDEFRRIAEASLSETERALLVMLSFDEYSQSVSVSGITDVLERAGHAKINRSRLRAKLDRDSRCIKNGSGYRIRPTKRDLVHELATGLFLSRRPPLVSTWIDANLVCLGPNYVRDIVDQINATYSINCFDACSVMVRRLTETLLIEAFERNGAIDQITDAQGDLLTLKYLIEKAKITRAFTISRQTKNALPHLKDVGDWSAHNRRYLAKKSDLDRVHPNLRLVLADFGHLSGMN